MRVGSRSTPPRPFLRSPAFATISDMNAVNPLKNRARRIVRDLAAPLSRRRAAP